MKCLKIHILFNIKWFVTWKNFNTWSNNLIFLIVLESLLDVSAVIDTIKTDVRFSRSKRKSLLSNTIGIQALDHGVDKQEFYEVSVLSYYLQDEIFLYNDKYDFKMNFLSYIFIIKFIAQSNIFTYIPHGLTVVRT